MKQHITHDQYNELSEKAKDRLWKWADGKIFKDMVFPMFSIGQMIEFLDTKDAIVFIENEVGLWRIFHTVPTQNLDNESYSSYELCDALWEAVKEVLNAKEEK